jgi:hypothetical protein
MAGTLLKVGCKLNPSANLATLFLVVPPWAPSVLTSQLTTGVPLEGAPATAHTVPGRVRHPAQRVTNSFEFEFVRIPAPAMN